MIRRRPMQSGGRNGRNRAWLSVLAALWVVVCACGEQRPLLDSGTAVPDAESELSVKPTRLSAFGNDPIVIMAGDLSLDDTAPPAVTLASRLCLDVVRDEDGSLSCLPQGSPESGPVWLSVRGDTQRAQAFGLVTIDAPRDRVFDRLAAIGGSWTAGMQSGSLSPDSQRLGIAAQLARQAGAYFPMPLVSRPGLPHPPGLADLDPQTGRLSQEWLSAATQALQETDGVQRADATLVVQNLAIPLAGTPGDILGSEESDPDGRLWQDLLLDPLGERDADWTRLDLLVALKPTLVFAGFDLADYLHQRPVGAESGLREEEIAAEFAVLFDMVLSLPSLPVLVLMNLPPAGFWPGHAYSEWQRYESIWINNALFDAALMARSRYPGVRIVVVDSFSFVFQMLSARGEVTRFGQSALLVDGTNGEADLLVRDALGREQRLGFDPFEGLFSLDWLTLSASGNALFANLVIETMNAEIGPDAAQPVMARDLPYVDIAERLAADPLSPHALAEAAAGLSLLPLDAYADTQAMPPLETAQRCAMRFAAGERPAADLCPVSLIINGGRPVVGQMNSSVEVLVDVTSYDTKPLVGYPLAVHARSGSVSDGPYLTDQNGRVRFRYTGLQGGYDTLTVACGAQIQSIQVPVSE